MRVKIETLEAGQSRTSTFKGVAQVPTVFLVVCNDGCSWKVPIAPIANMEGL